MKEGKGTKYIQVANVTFKVLPNVFSRIYSSDTIWFAENLLGLVKNKSFLEIGAGCGIIACLALMKGASKVVATDINPAAVANIKLNAKQHSLKLSIREGSVFEPIPNNEKFDIIFWNHPFYCAEKDFKIKDMLTASVYDIDYQYLKAFFANGKKHLTSKGELLLGSNNVARINLIKRMATKEGYKCTLLIKKDIPVTVYREKEGIKMDLRLYAFRIKD